MEFEKILFRIHEKFLSIEAIKKSIHVCFYGCLFLVLFMTPLFIYTNIHYRDNSYCLQPLVFEKTAVQNLTEGEQAIKPEHLSYIKVVSLTQTEIDEKAWNNTQINETDIIQIFEFSGNLHILMMNSTRRRSLNVTEWNFTIPFDCYADSWIKRFFFNRFFDLETILINEVLVTFKHLDRNVKNNATGEIWRWSLPELMEYQGYGDNNFLAVTFTKIFTLIRLVFGYFLCSGITALYIKITIICSPMFILMTYSCCNRAGSNNLAARLQVYRAFPWIGVYLYALLANGHKKQSYMIIAFVCLIIVFYCLYLSAITIWSMLLFSKSIPKSLDENFYGFIAFLEFSTLMLVRTRSTIKWLPRFALVFILCFLHYVQYTAYGFTYQALYLLLASVTGIFAYHLLKFEIPALSWNPSYHYTPSIESPRALFFPLFSLGWYHDLPQIWTMFYPLFGRSRFTQAQLAMVDRNGALLQQTLDEAFQRGDNLANSQNFQENIDGNNMENANGNGNPNDAVLDAEPVNQANNEP